jgi:ABC-type nitrate/sulfonate/bicarbonate transport system substrate-binding protein
MPIVHTPFDLAARCACQTQTSSASQKPAQLEVILFPSAAAAAVYAGVDRGDYARAGLEVRLTATPDSPFLISNLADGRFQMAAALADNFVAYQQGQHTAGHVAGRDLSIVMGLAKSSATLVARAGFPNVASLRNQILGVDAPGTGLAFVLYRMLEDAGLARGDYTLLRAGSTLERARALSRGAIDATLLTPEFAQDAQARGMHALAHSTALLPSYMGMTIAVEKSWAAENRATVESFICATLTATQWLTQPENRLAAIEIVSRHLQIPSEQIAQSVAALIRGDSLIRDGRIDTAGMDAVLALRARYGRPVRSAAPVAQFVDFTYLESVTRVNDLD